MTRLGTLLQLYRAGNHLPLEALAGEITITPRRLRALEQGSGALQDFAKVLVWLLAEEPRASRPGPPPPSVHIALTVDGERIADASTRGSGPQPRLLEDRPDATTRAPDSVADAVAE